MKEFEARIATRMASEHLQTLADRWRARYPVRFDALTGEIQLPGALLVMTADEESLTLRLANLTAASADGIRASVKKHLDAVAGQEGPYEYNWREF